MPINSISDFRKAYNRGLNKYAWPGGYPTFWLMADGAICAFAVAKTERRSMLEALRDYETVGNSYNNDWRPVALEINWEDGDLYCDHTGERIESAYARKEGRRTVV